jgi:hypothetical protein
MPAFTDTKPNAGALSTTDGAWVVELRERNNTVGIEVRDAATNTVKGWARIFHEVGTWRLAEFVPEPAALPKAVHAEARRIFSAVI